MHALVAGDRGPRRLRARAPGARPASPVSERRSHPRLRAMVGEPTRAAPGRQDGDRGFPSRGSAGAARRRPPTGRALNCSRDLECDGRLPDRLGELAWRARARDLLPRAPRLAVSRAWRNIIKAAYPRGPACAGARSSARSSPASASTRSSRRAAATPSGGLAKRSVEGSSYATHRLHPRPAQPLRLRRRDAPRDLGGRDRRSCRRVLGPSFDFSWAFHNPGTFLKAVAIVLAVALVIVLWFAEQIGDFRRRAHPGVRDPAGPARVPPAASRSGRGSTGRCGWSAVLFFLHAFGLPATVHNALLVQVSAGLASLSADHPVGDRHRAGVPPLPVARPGVEDGSALLQRRHADHAHRRQPRRSASQRSSSRCGPCTGASARGYDFDRPRYSMSVPDPGSDPVPKACRLRH